jgi:hypothetical protein
MFEIPNPLAVDPVEGSLGGPEHTPKPLVASVMLSEIDIGRKIFLARRPGEPRHAPPQYFYSASRTGVVPSWVGQNHLTHAGHCN